MLKIAPEAMLGNKLTRMRLLGYSERGPEALVGKKARITVLERYFEGLAETKGWQEDQILRQAEKGFKFPGRTFALYERKVLRQVLNGRKVNEIYFPAVYAGVVANAIASQGYNVIASDLSSVWAEHARSLGLNVEIRGFEQIPKDKMIDLIVVFEPFCIYFSPTSTLAIMRAISQNLPYLQIEGGMPEYYFTERMPVDEAVVLKVSSLKRNADGTYIRGPDGYETQGYYPEGKLCPLRIGYDYGAKYYDHVTYYEMQGMQYNGTVFRFSCLVPTPEAVARASLDLAIIERQSEWLGETVSLADLAQRFDQPINRITAAFSRVLKLFASDQRQTEVAEITIIP
ncbi:MAG: hypothetical protein ABII22_04815 [Candidatus Micrarchaeota archaeon]